MKKLFALLFAFASMVIVVQAAPTQPPDDGNTIEITTPEMQDCSFVAVVPVAYFIAEIPVVEYGLVYGLPASTVYPVLKPVFNYENGTSFERTPVNRQCKAFHYIT